MSAYQPFQGDYFVPATVVGMTSIYEVRQPMAATGRAYYSVWETFRDTKRLLIADLTWVEAMAFVVARTEREIAGEERREPESLS